MNAPRSPEERRIEFLRSTEFLVRAFPELDRVRRRAGEWNRYGGRVALEAAGARTPDGGGLLWKEAKLALARLAGSDEAVHAAIRKRARFGTSPSPIMFSELSLWLAGELKAPLTVTRRLVAAAMIGVASAGGDWSSLES